MRSVSAVITALFISFRLAAAENEASKNVALDVHIMSKCPDARDCMELLVSPAMEEIAGDVDFKLEFIGRETAEGGIACKHGPDECLGNMVHLCGFHLYTTDIALPFSMCLLHQYELLPEKSFIEDCAESHGVDFQKINDCISDLGPEGGMALLSESVERSRDADAQVSCTVRVAGKKWCVRDGGVWKECSGGSEVGDLVKVVEEKWRGRQEGVFFVQGPR
ncbi:hypothetical protein RUND412_006262 [Rhizina undulata]